MTKEKILIVGAGAKVASFIATHYSTLGYEIYGVTREPSQCNSRNFERVLTYREGLRSLEFKKVFILASRLPGQAGGIEDFVSDNMKPVEWLKENCEITGKVIFFSSFSVYDKDQTLITNATKYTKNDVYGISKLVTENYVINNFKSVLILRIPVLLCAGVKNNFAAKLKLAIEKKATFIFENLESRVNAFFRVEDLPALENKYENTVINCGTKPDWKIKDIADFAVECGLTNYSERPASKLPQEVELIDGAAFSSTSEALKKYLREASLENLSYDG